MSAREKAVIQLVSSICLSVGAGLAISAALDSETFTEFMWMFILGLVMALLGGVMVNRFVTSVFSAIEATKPTNSDQPSSRTPQRTQSLDIDDPRQAA